MAIAKMVLKAFLVFQLLLGSVVRGDLCTSSSFRSVSVSSTRRSPELSVSGRANSTWASAAFLSGNKPRYFRLSLRRSDLQSELVAGDFVISAEGSNAGKYWRPRVRHFGFQGSVRAKVSGLFNSTSNHLCAKVCLRLGNRTKLQAPCESLLSLQYPPKKTIADPFVVGELRSLLPDSHKDHFAPVSLSGESGGTYEFTRLRLAEEACASNEQLRQTSVASMDGNSTTMDGNSTVCHSGLSDLNLNVSWKASCDKQVCYPFHDDGSSTGPRTLSFDMVCSSGGRVSGYLRLDGNDFGSGINVLAVEGLWSKQRLCMVACQTLTTNSSPKDCSIQVTLQFPSHFSIHQRSPVVGSIRSLRQESDPLFFARFSFRADSQMFRYFSHDLADYRYVYSKVAEADKHCPAEAPPKKSEKYPSHPYFHDFSFQGSLRKEPFSFSPVSLDNNLPWTAFRRYVHPKEEVSDESVKPYKTRFNISFDVTVGGEFIAAEGFYDARRGTACLMGCKAVNNASSTDLEQGKDCKIFLKIKYPPALGSGTNRQTLATISSLRQKKTDPLYFKTIKLQSSQPMYMVEATRSIWMKDLEIFLSMMTLSLVLIVLVFQLVRTTRHEKLRPYTSLVMLSVLVLGHMVPLVLNFEAVFSNSSSSSNGLSISSSDSLSFSSGRGQFLQIKEVAIRLMNMTAFLLLLWLLHLVWNSRRSSTKASSAAAAAEMATFGESSRLINDSEFATAQEENPAEQQTSSTAAGSVEEKSVLLICLPLYVGGALAASGRQWLLRKSLWSGLKAYAGLSLDLFLVPQVVAYVVWGVKASAISPSFVLGMTLARLLPHGFDIYRLFNPSFFEDGDWRNFYFANREWDFFSLAWDVSIPCCAIVVAVLVLVQQKYGGRCFVPARCFGKF